METFSKNEISIIEDRAASFEAAKAEFHKDDEALKNGEMDFMSLEEFEKEMIM